MRAQARPPASQLGVAINGIGQAGGADSGPLSE